MRDLIIPIEPDGRLKNLPAAFSPARLSHAFAKEECGPRRRLDSITLEVGDNKALIPRPVAQMIHVNSALDIRATASWNHSPKLMPPYLAVRYPISGGCAGDADGPGFLLLFNLQTALLMKMEAWVAWEHKNEQQIIPVDVGGLCMGQPVGAFYAPLTFDPDWDWMSA